MDAAIKSIQPSPLRFLWRRGEAVLPGGEVHLWTFRLALPEGTRLERVEADLPPDERARAARFLVQDARRRFVLARTALREVLAAYLGRRRDEVALRAGSKGKPLMADEADGWLRFNLSHSGDAAAIACARGRDVGVDIESFRRDLAHDAIVARYFSDAERREWAALPPADREGAFLRGWTCKEAYVKALGEGLTHPPDAYTVRLNPAGPAALLDDRLRPGASSAWSLHTPPAPDGYVLAVAVAGLDATVVSQSATSLREEDAARGHAPAPDRPEPSRQ